MTDLAADPTRRRKSTTGGARRWHKHHRSTARTCHYCGRLLQPAGAQPVCRDLAATIDHKTPKIMGGRDSAENTVVACASCNRVKRYFPYDVFVAYVAQESERDRADGYARFITFTHWVNDYLRRSIAHDLPKRRRWWHWFKR